MLGKGKKGCHSPGRACHRQQVVAGRPATPPFPLSWHSARCGSGRYSVSGDFSRPREEKARGLRSPATPATPCLWHRPRRGIVGGRACAVPFVYPLTLDPADFHLPPPPYNSNFRLYPSARLIGMLCPPSLPVSSIWQQWWLCVPHRRARVSN